MSSTEPGFDHRDAETPANEFPVEVWSLLKTISSQIDEVDQRHTGLLQDLRERLAQLGQAAENVRANVPEGAAPVYSRIEDGLAKLAYQIDAMEDMAVGTDRAGAEPPAALKSASNRDTAPAHALSTSGFDPFDVVGDDDGDTPWNAADAEALSRVYEESDAALVRLTPRTDAAAAQPAGEPAADPLLAFGGAALEQSTERDWLEHRLSDIAVRIEQSLAEFRGDFTMEKLGSRFEAFETHLGTVLGDVATRTDLESLRILEGQVQDLASHLEQAEQQLGRLDGIEQQLQAVIDHLSTEADGSGSGGLAASETPDFKSLASVTAEEVAQRFAAQIKGAGNGGDPRIDELGSLLRSMIHDRRHSDDQTYAMLDTVQQAMIRLLDRIDALEMAQVQSQPLAPASATMEAAAVEDFGAPEPVAPVVPRQPAAPASVAAVTPPLAAVPSSVDKLRQDFIADAQRAKARAAAAAAEAELTATTPAAPSARMPRGTPRASLPPVTAPDVQGSLGSTRKQRPTALALVLVIAVSGAALFAKSRTPAAPSATPAAVSTTVPGDAASPTAEDVLGGGIDVPAAPKNLKAATKPATGAPAPVEGAGFEAPADEPAAVPAPVPQPVPAAEAPAAQTPSDAAPVAGPQTNEGVLEFDEEIPGSSETNEGGEPDEASPQNESSAPKGIILQDNGRAPTARELVQLQSQQNVAALSSRLGHNASRLSPADLMPEEVAKHSVTRIAAGGDDIAAAQPVPASLSVAALPGETVDVPATDTSKTFSQLSLPPATVGPLSLRLAAANGDPSAAFEVGARLAEGKGTNQNFHEAIIWYQKSASQGFAQSQYRLGTLYERGLGVKADIARAQMWYQRAAEQGHVKAMHNLAVLSAGRSSGQPDYATASVWFEKAANYGLADSQYNLAVLHENGLGVAKDFVRAYKWYSLAGQGGDAEAMRRRDVLKAQLTADQRLQAENAVAAFVPERTIPLVNDARVAGEDWKKRQDG